MMLAKVRFNNLNIKYMSTIGLKEIAELSEQLVCYICKTNPVEVEDDICKNCADESE